jgi:hypothetical protein
MPCSAEGSDQPMRMVAGTLTCSLDRVQLFVLMLGCIDHRPVPNRPEH